MKRKRVRKSMMITIGILLCAVGTLLIFFNIPYSKVKTEFNEMAAHLIAQADRQDAVFREEDIAGLPDPVKRYFRYCGYIGKPKTAYMKITYPDVSFSFGKDKAPLKIDYTQYNDVGTPDRIAYIDSSMYGIPFEGLDALIGGAGSMKGVLAKGFILFNYTGREMDQSSLVTFLSECLFTPTAALQSYIQWDPIDDSHAKATISYRDIHACGIFTFNESGEMLSFWTDDRAVALDDGTNKQVKWSVQCGEYIEVDGVARPTAFQAIWHYDDGDLTYFNGKGTITTYN